MDDDVPASDVQLYMGDGTEVGEAIQFVEARLRNPAIVGDVVVFNFHNESLEAQPFVEWADAASPGIYIVPYQIPAVWRFMAAILPRSVERARILAYRQRDNEYVDYANWVNEVNGESYTEILDLMTEILVSHGIAEEVLDGVE